MNKNKKFYNFTSNSDNTANLYIYGTITSWRWDDEDVSAESFKKELEALGNIETLNVHINSCGGEVFQGLAIYNLIKQHNAKVNVYIDGIAASIASVIAMAGDKIYIPKTALMMIHNCSTWTGGNSKELRKTADDMDKIMEALKASYLERIKITEDKLQELLDEESYLTAEECIEMGFADEIIEDIEENPEMVASTNIYKLVMKLKEKENMLNKTSKNKTEEIANKIYENLSKSILENMEDFEKRLLKKIKEEKNQNLTNNNKDIKKDTLAVSFLNNFLNNKGGN